ncbi:BAG family molecular chaperone regulator 2-like [Bidens hawaiensis]|uniref:BAG family molecular chaperone regulator 2-like n=1 Tax=Bidens hawaiensis TaxID=980011 RepID=UPI004049C802
MIMKFRSMKLPRSFSKFRFGKINGNNNNKRQRVSLERCNGTTDVEIKWELRPNGMLVQKRDLEAKNIEGFMVVKVVSGSRWHEISIQHTSTFGESSMGTKEYCSKGKREKMVGVKDKDKVLMLHDPSVKERKLVANAK